MLKQRLRETDLIGRYGGEEFAVILPDTDANDAARVLDELRAGFGQIHHQSGEAQFYVTFSCGVSSLADFDDASALNDAADRALYVAKQAGRNCVIKAQP
jgi:diguanylate cyclase (GGDEF)-like protein